ncbi:MAG: hypothetical protein IJG38_00135 [Thermoguttaceae bacterium]|nr:hypothetical protein [Thermoguttaceae bacterium]MBQ3348783.1 hypothetical protein [Thermoguttaceae bacterium]
MCVIVVKPAGVQISIDTIRKCWAKNPHGAGIAFMDGDAVQIKKGFMNLDEFLDYLSSINLTETNAVLHFRISTSGGINPGMTHPFPISAEKEDLTASEIRTPVAVVHNGIIPTIPQPGLSDTATYIAETLLSRYKADPHFYDDEENRVVILDEIQSKMVLVDTEYFYLIGEFFKRKGVYYSNLYWI